MCLKEFIAYAEVSIEKVGYSLRLIDDSSILELSDTCNSLNVLDYVQKLMGYSLDNPFDKLLQDHLRLVRGEKLREITYY